MRTLIALVSAISVVSISGCSGGRAAGEPQYEEGAVIHQATAADLEAVKSKEPLAANQALLYVNGLGCPLCATNVDVQLKRIKGITDAKVDLGAGTVLIDMPGQTKPSPKRLADAVEDAGFTLVKIEVK